MRQFLVPIGELPSKEGNCTVFIEEEETDNACQGQSSLVAAETTRKDYDMRHRNSMNWPHQAIKQVVYVVLIITKITKNIDFQTLIVLSISQKKRVTRCLRHYWQLFLINWRNENQGGAEPYMAYQMRYSIQQRACHCTTRRSSTTNLIWRNR